MFFSDKQTNNQGNRQTDIQIRETLYAPDLSIWGHKNFPKIQTGTK